MGGADRREGIPAVSVIPRRARTSIRDSAVRTIECVSGVSVIAVDHLLGAGCPVAGGTALGVVELMLEGVRTRRDTIYGQFTLVAAFEPTDCIARRVHRPVGRPVMPVGDRNIVLARMVV
ncbi:hypothetical protein IFU11_05430 [Plantibacter sp. CFBP 8804]|nr:hypothetical protein [Plantibacter sp. CFBP 8804]